MSQSVVDNIISNLLSLKNQPQGTNCNLTYQQIFFLCKECRQIFLEQDMVLELSAPITICGDIHGQYNDLLRIFEASNYPPRANYLFLGDYVDRGSQSIETICLLLAYKIKYPNNFFLIRGNHECSYINRQYGFFEDCVSNYNINLWRSFSDLFNCMPIAAIIDDKIFCVHGGLSPDLKSVEQIRQIRRPIEIPENGLLHDLVWSDPSSNENPEDWAPSPRGTSFIYGPKPIKTFLDKHDFELLCRAHQVVMSGYEFPFKDEHIIVTIFSASNYCGEYQNQGAFLKVDKSLYCTFGILEPDLNSSSFLKD